MGLVGAVLVAVWAWGLLRDTGRVLLDAEMDAPVVGEVREIIEHGTVPARITDLHLWRVGRAKYACVLSLTTPSTRTANISAARCACTRNSRTSPSRSIARLLDAGAQRRNGIFTRREFAVDRFLRFRALRVLHQSLLEMRREHLQEVVHESAQQHAAAETHPRGVHRETGAKRRAP